MKKILVFILWSCTATYAYSQRIMMPSTPVTDSLTPKFIKHNEVQDAAGNKMESAKDIVENLAHASKFSILSRAINSAELTETLKSKGPITVFAPTNDAFRKLPRGRMDTLIKKRHMLELSNLITCHAVAQRLSIKDMIKKIKAGKGKAVYTTISGCKLTVSLDANHKIILTDELGNQCMVEPTDIEQSNGLIHVINRVLLPKTPLI